MNSGDATWLATTKLMLWHALDSQGVDARALFEQAGLDLDAVRDPDARYPAGPASRLWALATEATGEDLQFVEGRFIPIAFFSWDGSNGEAATKHTMTTWYWLLLAPAGGSQPFIAAIVVALLLLGAEILWARGAMKRRES